MICRRDIGWLHLGNFHDRYVTDKRLYELVRNFGLRLLASFLQRFFHRFHSIAAAPASQVAFA